MEKTNYLDQVFLALADQNRRDMLRRILNETMTISEIAKFYEMSLPAISKHIATLERARLVKIDKKGRTKTLILNLKGIEIAQTYLETLSPDNFVDALETHLIDLFSN